ncbi:MAG: sulfotransferase [Acidobacteria bacterium]|nr:MAG: sulfotransferase [Acidobacteriota bacterium]
MTGQKVTQESRCTFVSVATCAYSGATLLAFLLGSHPEIATVGEMDGLIPSENPEQYRCSCGERIRDCDFWVRVAAGMSRRGFSFDVGHFDLRFSAPVSRIIRYIRMGSTGVRLIDSLRDSVFFKLPSERRRTAALAARNVAFIRTVLEVTGKRIFVDTSKGPFRLPALARFSSLNLRAIHLIRDVRGVVASRIRHGTTLPVRKMARQWVTSNRRIQGLLRGSFRDRYLTVRYEDLCRDLEVTVRSIQDFCGCQKLSPPLDSHGFEHHILGNPMRLHAGSAVRLDEQWRTLLTRRQLAAIRHVTESLNRHLGYAEEATGEAKEQGQRNEATNS